MPNAYVNKVAKGDGTVLIDLSGDTVTSANHIMNGYVGHLADGSQVTGTGGGISISEVANATGTTLVITSGGNTPSATSHTIYFEFSDSTNASVTGYWDSSFISDAIRATSPTTYNNKTVTLAQLDGVTWYEITAGIPLNTELIDFSKVIDGYEVDENGQLSAYEWCSVSDYTDIDPTMTFTFAGFQWGYMAFYNSNKQFISSAEINNYADTASQNTAHGTLSGARIPSNAAYIRITSVLNPTSSYLSLIRTA